MTDKTKATTEKLRNTPDVGDFTRVSPTPQEGIHESVASIGQRAIADFIQGKSFSEMGEKQKAEAVYPTLPAEPARSGVDAQIDALEKSIDQIEKAAELTYEQKIKNHGLSMDEALDIVNAILDNGYYEKAYRVTPRWEVVFRTRTTADQDRVLRRIEDANPQFPATVTQILAKYNLAASMIRFKGIDFSKKDFDERLKFVMNLPEVMLRVLSGKLARFDQLMLDVLDEGAIQNF